MEDDTLDDIGTDNGDNEIAVDEETELGIRPNVSDQPWNWY